MSEPGSLHHAIDYIEFCVTDIAEAKRFYEAAFGWSFTDYGPGYCGFGRGGAASGREMGGLRLVDAVTTGGPLVVLYSENLDDSFAKAREAGARITKEPFDFPGGRRFELLDPSGNALGVWSAPASG